MDISHLYKLTGAEIFHFFFISVSILYTTQNLCKVGMYHALKNMNSDKNLLMYELKTRSKKSAVDNF